MSRVARTCFAREPEVDSKFALAAVLAMGTVGEVFIYVVPILLGSVVDSFALREGTAGIIVAIEIAASAMSAIMFSSLVHRLPIRRVGIICIIIVILGDFTSAFAGPIILFVGLRVIAAFAAGALFALANALVAKTDNPEKAYALLGISVILAATIGFLLLTYAIERYGPQSAFAALAFLSLFGVPFMFWLPRAVIGHVASEGHMPLSSMRTMALSMLLGSFILYVGQNAVWVYVERIGISIGLPMRST